jgi:nicotinate-nucleotide--dimethylbenzimidazole phosphoribosyltransferase
MREKQPRVPVIVDGLPATAAAIVAQAIDSNVTAYLLALTRRQNEARRSQRPRSAGHRSSIWVYALGEGTGALLALNLVRTAVELQLSMTTFATTERLGE